SRFKIANHSASRVVHWASSAIHPARTKVCAFGSLGCPASSKYPQRATIGANPTSIGPVKQREAKPHTKFGRRAASWAKERANHFHSSMGVPSGHTSDCACQAGAREWEGVSTAPSQPLLQGFHGAGKAGARTAVTSRKTFPSDSMDQPYAFFLT